MKDCCKLCDGWPDEGYCTAQGTCTCHHTPENPAQEKRVWWPSYADETKIPTQESICTCSIKSIRHSSFCPVSLLKDWPKAETKMSISSFTGPDPTKKPPIEEAASEPSSDDEEIELTPEQTAIIELAKYIEVLPGNQYKVKEHIFSILGIEWVPDKEV